MSVTLGRYNCLTGFMPVSSSRWEATLSTTSTETQESPFPLYLSPSQISQLLTCGEKFRLTRVLRLHERPMWASVGGSTVHRVTEILDREKYAAEH